MAIRAPDGANKKMFNKIYNNQQAVDIIDMAFERKYSWIFLLDNSPPPQVNDKTRK